MTFGSANYELSAFELPDPKDGCLTDALKGN